MGWQATIFERLRDREWHHLGELFEEIEMKIPLHYAMRAAMQPRRGLTDLPTNSQARWYKFLNDLSTFGIETSGDPLRRKWTDQVRLRYVADRQCAECGGPVIKAGWAARGPKMKVVCLYCNPPVLASFTAASPVSRKEPAQNQITDSLRPGISTPPGAAGTIIPPRLPPEIALVPQMAMDRRQPIIIEVAARRVIFEDRRTLARNIRNFLGWGSINAIERDLQYLNPAAVLMKRGATIAEFFRRIFFRDAVSKSGHPP